MPPSPESSPPLVLPPEELLPPPEELLLPEVLLLEVPLELMFTVKSPPLAAFCAATAALCTERDAMTRKLASPTMLTRLLPRLQLTVGVGLVNRVGCRLGVTDDASWVAMLPLVGPDASGCLWLCERLSHRGLVGGPGLRCKVTTLEGRNASPFKVV